MEKNIFHEMLENLYDELKKLQSIDERDRNILLDVENEIQRLVNRKEEYKTPKAPRHHMLIEQLSEAISYFEESHPKLAMAMKQVIDTLSNMGI